MKQYAYILILVFIILSTACNRNNDDDDDFQGYYFRYEVDGIPSNPPVLYDHQILDTYVCKIHDNRVVINAGDLMQGVRLQINQVNELANIWSSVHHCSYYHNGNVYNSWGGDSLSYSYSNANVNFAVFADTVIQGKFVFKGTNPTDTISYGIRNGEFRVRISR